MNPVTITYDIHRNSPCPCKRGEWLYEANQNDWGKVYGERRTMLCPDCEGNYYYDPRVIERYHDDTRERGWVSREHLEAEYTYIEALREYQQSIVREADRRCRTRWAARLATCRTKKQVWEVLDTRQTYGTFTSHHRDRTLAQLVAKLSADPFPIYLVRVVLKACGMVETPDDLTNLEEPVAPASLPECLRYVSGHQESLGYAVPGPPRLDRKE